MMDNSWTIFRNKGGIAFLVSLMLLSASTGLEYCLSYPAFEAVFPHFILPGLYSATGLMLIFFGILNAGFPVVESILYLSAAAGIVFYTGHMLLKCPFPVFEGLWLLSAMLFTGMGFLCLFRKTRDRRESWRGLIQLSWVLCFLFVIEAAETV